MRNLILHEYWISKWKPRFLSSYGYCHVFVFTSLWSNTGIFMDFCFQSDNQQSLYNYSVIIFVHRVASLICTWLMKDQLNSLSFSLLYFQVTMRLLWCLENIEKVRNSAENIAHLASLSNSLFTFQLQEIFKGKR